MTIKIARSIADVRAELTPSRAAGRTIGLVPTMGYFHDGHVSLMRAARDVAIAADADVDLMFAPSAEEMYPPASATRVSVTGVSEPLEGTSRGASHFTGVATVVAKLFNIVQPAVAFFGQKDAQQALVIRRMTRDLDISVRIEVCPTIREHDGLAMSSRNVRLDAEARQRALALSAGLRAAENALANGTRDARELLATARETMNRAGIEPEYLEIVSTDTLAPVTHLIGEALLAVAARVGGVRLIDNVILRTV